MTPRFISILYFLHFERSSVFPLFLFKVGWNLAVGCAIINTIVEIVEKRVEDTNEARREE